MGHKISILGYDACSAGVLMSTADLFNAANAMARRLDDAIGQLFDLQIVSHGGREIVCSNGYSIKPDGDLDDIARNGVVIFHAHRADTCPNGMHAPSDRVPWQTVAASLGSVLERIQYLLTNWRLDSRPKAFAPGSNNAPCHKPEAADFDVDILSAESEKILYVPPSMRWVDACFSVIERQGGRDFAQNLARYLARDWQLGIYADYETHPVLKEDSSLSYRAERWIQENISKNFSVEDVANHLAVSTRTLIRRFQERFGLSPQTYIQQTRIERCKLLLETTSLRFSQIVARCGYSDESAFRRLFKKKCQVSPMQYRKTRSAGRWPVES